MNARFHPHPLTTALVALFVFAVPPSSHAGVLQDLLSGNGGADPFNRNNNLGIAIKVPQFRPQQTPSTITDPITYSYRLDSDGNIFRRNGTQEQKLPQRAELLSKPDGTTYWRYGNLTTLAKPQYWNKQLIQQLQQQKAAEEKYEADLKQKAEARQHVIQLEQMIENTPLAQIEGEVQRLPNQPLIEAKVRIEVLISLVRAEQLADTTGFERLLIAVNDEIGRRTMLAQNQAQQPIQPNTQPQDNATTVDPPPGQGDGELFANNLGISYRPIPNGDGTFNLQLTRPPAPGSPAEHYGFEAGDVIVELDGQRFTKPDDVLDHRFQTEIGFIDVRSGDSKVYSIYIP